MVEHKVLNLDSKGNWSDITDSDFGGDTTFRGEEGFERAMDLRNHLGGDAVVFTETHPGYIIIRNSMRHHQLILTTQHFDSHSYTAYTYISDGDGFGRAVYGSSKGGYKSFKGASKRVRQYMDWR